MKASKLSDAQKMFILKQGDEGLPVAETCRKAGISSATYFNWKKKNAGLLLDTEEVRLAPFSGQSPLRTVVRSALMAQRPLSR